MSTVAEIRAALKTLSVEEKAELLADLCDWTDDDWDRQMRSDAEAGRFGALNDAAAADNQSGKARALAQLLAEREQVGSVLETMELLANPEAVAAIQRDRSGKGKYFPISVLDEDPD